MKVHFFTIVLNGYPFIKEQYHRFESYKNLDWHWHIIEGVAEHKLDTAWSLENGGKILDTMHTYGLSVDGTRDWINFIKEKFPFNVTVYRKPKGEFWEGKLEMINAPLPNITEESLLWQLDVDEFWTEEQILKIQAEFEEHPDVSAAYFWCNFFVGDNLKVVNRRCYGNRPQYEWLRVHRFTPGCGWMAHEPPVLTGGTPGRALTHRETEAHGCVFDHYAYSSLAQVKFKEEYYGYKGAVDGWNRLQAETNLPVLLKDYFHWVLDNAIVDRVSK
jgi:hypothetical protein